MDVVPTTRGHWRAFFINLSLVILLAVSGLCTGLALSTGRTIEAEIATRARTIFGALVLARLDRGEPEVSGRERRGESVLFRYLGLLRVEQSCLECHTAQGYQIGQVRGEISVTFDVTDTEKGVVQARWIAISLFGFTTVALLMVLGGLVSSLHRRSTPPRRASSSWPSPSS